MGASKKKETLMPQRILISVGLAVLAGIRSLSCVQHLLLPALCTILCHPSIHPSVQAGDVELIGRSTVDHKTLTFAEGPAARFAGTVNGRSHQQEPLTTYRGYQYVTYVDAERRICVGRRKLPSGAWEIVQFKDHKLESNDAHNTLSLIHI